MSNYEERFHCHVGSIRAKTLLEQAKEWQYEHDRRIDIARDDLLALRAQRMPQHLFKAVSDEVQRIKHDRSRLTGTTRTTETAGAPLTTEKLIPDWAEGKAWRENRSNFNKED